MMIDALAAASAVLSEDRYREAAERAARFLLQTMRSPEGRLWRTYNNGSARLNAYLEDYAYLANALVTVYEATFDPAWITRALEIVDTMIERFWDETDGGFFYTSSDHETLIARGKDPHDNAIPSGNSMAVTALARLGKLTGRSELIEKVDATLAAFRSVMTQSAMASAQMLIGLGVHLGPTYEFALVGDPASEETKAALRAIHQRFVPNKVLAMRRPGDAEETGRLIPLLADKPSQPGGPTLYVCHNFTCENPAVGLDSITAALDAIATSSRGAG
jgi:hypothetical protein